MVLGPAPLATGKWNGSQGLRSFRLSLSHERLPLDPQLPLKSLPDPWRLKWEQQTTCSNPLSGPHCFGMARVEEHRWKLEFSECVLFFRSTLEQYKYFTHLRNK